MDRTQIYSKPMLSAFGILEVSMSVNRWTGALQVQSRFPTVRISQEIHFQNALLSAEFETHRSE